MRNIYILIILIFSIVSTGIAQTPQGAIFPENYGNGAALIQCMGNEHDAGTFQLGNYQNSALSNDISKERIFLCAYDKVPLIHDRNQILDGDPNPATTPGVGYGFYNCAPTINGTSLSDVAADICHVTSPPPPSGAFYVIVDGNLDGDVLLNNDGGLNNAFNGGNPGTWWFAPITFDDVEIQGGSYFAKYEQGNNQEGPCVNVRTDQAVEVTYLNPFRISQQTTSSGNDGECLGSFVIEGGYPEYNNKAFYEIEIVSTSNPNNKGKLSSNNYKHGDRIDFSVPIGGEYAIHVQDGKSCVQTIIIDVDCNSLHLIAPKLDVELGEEFCVPITVSNFDSLISLSFTLQFDPGIIQYLEHRNSGVIPGDAMVGEAQVTQGRVTYIWLAESFPEQDRVTLPDGTAIIEFCFRVTPQAKIGDISPLDFTNTPTAVEAVSMKVKPDGTFDSYVEIGVKMDHGHVRIVTESDIFFDWTSCGSDIGLSNGVFNIKAHGGRAPYTVNWQADWGGGPSGTGTINQEEGTYTVTGADYGSYTVTITDADGSTYTAKVTVSDVKPRPEFDISFLDPTCHNINNGRITLSNIDASAPYTIEWSNGRFNDTELKYLSSGHYSVTITDNFGCSAEESGVIKYQKIKLEITGTEVSCQGQNNGQATISARGGVPMSNNSYSFRFENGDTETGNNILRENLGYGWHRVTITDDNSCVNVDSFFMDATKKLVFNSINRIEPTCADSEDGSITFNPGTTGATASTPYTIYLIGTNSSINLNNTGNSGIQFNNIPGDDFIVKLMDAAGCVLDTIIPLNAPEPITVNPDHQNSTCENGGDQGSIRLNATGGTGSLKYSWDGTKTDGGKYFPPASDYIRNLPAGTYKVTITDDNDCTYTASYIITEPEGPEIDRIDRKNITCASECDGELTVYVLQGPADIVDIYWVTTNYDTLRGTTISNLCSDTYTVHVVDANGCIAKRIITMEEPEPLVLENEIIGHPDCAGRNSGFIEISISGGATPYTYNWSPGGLSNSPRLDNIGAGTYSVTVSDAGGCSQLTREFTLVDPPAMNVNFINVTPASCFNSCDGHAYVDVSGGTGGPFTYLWSNGSTVADNANLCAGENYVIVSDGSCTDTFYVNIASPPAINLDIVDLTSPTCHGEKDGRIEVLASGGSGTFIYQWDNGSIDHFLENLGGGSYGLTITDGSNCSLDTTIVLTEPDALDIRIEDSSNVTCAGEQDGYIVLNVSGGNGGYTYQWSGNVSNTNSAMNLGNGTYTVTVTDAAGCRDTIQKTINVPPVMEFRLANVADAHCYGEDATIHVLSATGGNGAPYLGEINGQTFSVPGAIDVPAGDYILSIMDKNGCVVDTSISISQPPQIQIDMPSTITINLGDVATISPVVFGNTVPIRSYSWTPASGVDCPDCKDVTVLLTDDGTLTFMVTDENGCTAEKTVDIKINKQRNVYFPTAFTPNGDGINDIYRIYVNFSVEEVEYFTVFDRWGNKLWEDREIPIVNNASARGWNGMSKDKSLNPGVYVFNAKLRFKDGVTRQYAGDITILDRISYD